MTMAGFLRENSRPAFMSLLLHGLIAVALLWAADFSFQHATVGAPSVPIEATVVSSRVVLAAAAERQHAAAAVEQAAAAAKAAALAQQQRQQAQQQALQQQRERQAQQRQLAQARAADQAAAAKAAKRQAAAAEVAERQAAAEQAAKRQAAAEAQRQAAVEAARRRAAARAAVQAQLQRQIAAEARADALASGPLADQYRAELQNRIIQAWIKPPAAKRGIDCFVRITQVPGGDVTGATVTQCNGDAAVRQSIQNAVYRASPLPTPPDPSLYHRTLIIEFKPNE